MKFLIAPDKFKGSLSASQAADCIAGGVRRAVPDAEIDSCPIADGGEGTVSAMLAARGGKLIHRRVTGPLPEMKVDAAFAMLPDGTAVIEMAAASGLSLLSEADRNPLNTTTFGTGELIAAAIAEGAKSIIFGLGGSATIDAGIGCAQACGFTILMRDGQPVSRTEPLCGKDLNDVLMVKHGRGEVTAGIPIFAAADVDNPLCGPQGAARNFGPQKGASPQVIELIDACLSGLVQRTGARTQADVPGAGAAGGLGFGILAFFGGTVGNGFEFISNAIRFRERLIGTGLCITAEGRLDSQTLRGKTVAGIARLCKAGNIPCIALTGSIATGIESLFEEGLTACFSITKGPISLADSIFHAADLLEQSAFHCARLYQAKVRDDK